LKILFLSQYYSITRGGGEYVVSLIAKKLAQDNHKVFVVTNKIKDEEYERYQNIEIIFVPPTLQYKGGLPPTFGDNIRYCIGAVRKGLDIIKKEKIDIIHSNNFAPALAGSILSSLSSVPHVTIVHDIFSLCGKNFWKMWGKQSDVSRLNVSLAPFFEKLMLKLRYSCIHTVSEATRDDLVKFGAKKPIHVIYNSVETNTGSDTRPNPVQFVYIGRLVFYKNLEVAIRAIEIVKKTEPAIKLVIIGSGPHRDSLEALVRKLGLEQNIEFCGYVTPEKKSRAISESCALVFPSLCEGFGLVILESYERRRPALVSDIRPMSEIVSHGTTGYVLDPHDEKKWADSILEISKDQAKASNYGNNGYQRLVSLYNQDLMYQKVLKMYQVLQKKAD
jgi:glycosyltransferase involved in cell wall biosynthesis